MRADHFLGHGRHLFQSTPDREAGRCDLNPPLVRPVAVFQSTPDREAGRCLMPSMKVCAASLFQSTPDREAGRCGSQSTLGHPLRPFQSTPDREAGRCPIPWAIPRCPTCFNPRPTVRPGDAMGKTAFAMQIAACFNPRPTVRPGDARWPKPQAAPGRFNPRPTVRPGDAGAADDGAYQQGCFNPRPTVRPGDAYKHPLWQKRRLVSIHARP